MIKKITQLEILASKLVGDGKSPNLFFVTKEGVVVMITRYFSHALALWRDFPRNVESAIEDRKHGVICSVEWEQERNRWITIDDSSSLFGSLASR